MDHQNFDSIDRCSSDNYQELFDQISNRILNLYLPKLEEIIKQGDFKANNHLEIQAH